jgi:hypothetical protein
MKKKTTGGARKKAASKVDLATPVSQRIELENLLLLETVARRQPLRGTLPAHISVNVDVKTDANKKEGVIQVRPHFVLVARFENESNDELMRIEAVFLLQYRVPSFDGLRKANITAFGEMNGLYNAWPYWREFVQATTVRMGLPALTVPVYRPIGTPSPGKKKLTSRTSHPKSGKGKRVAAAAR